MEDSDGPVVARAVYSSLTYIFEGFPAFVEDSMKGPSKMTETICAHMGISFEELKDVIAKGNPRCIASLSLARVVDDLAREPRVNGAPAERWATFVHIGI